MFFLPQRPYCTLGPLRDQITYPNAGTTAGVIDGGEGEGLGGDGNEGGGGEGESKSSLVQDAGSSDEDGDLLALLDKVKRQYS